MTGHQFMEHRWGTRVELRTPALLRTDAGRNFHATIRNASLTGAFVETRSKVPLLSWLSIQPLDNGEWLDACVVRLEDRGMGLEWSDPGSAPLCALLSLSPVDGGFPQVHQ